ncbi:MAG: 50S ribosomal protein L31 [bacterium]|nr:50S ribosomal protein L31 [bacterium]
MKKDIHPKYVECTVRCSCGNTFTTRSTVSELRLDLCNECHPFFTGQQKFVDTGGRVQRFSDKFGSASAAVLEREQAKKAQRQAAAAAEQEARKAARDAKVAEKAAKAAVYARKAAKKAEEEAAAAAEAPAEAVEAEAEAPAEDAQ